MKIYHQKYLNVIRPYLRNLINENKPIMELNNNSNNNNNNRAEWKIQLTMKTNSISTKSFEDKRTIFSKSEPVEIFMGSNTKDVIDKLAGLNYNKINEKELKKLLKFRRVDTDFSSYQRDWEEFEQENN